MKLMTVKTWINIFQCETNKQEVQTSTVVLVSQANKQHL